MHRTFITLGCALALAGGSALAQQQGSTANNGPSVTEKIKVAAKDVGQKTKEAAKEVGQKTKEAGVKVKDKAVEVGKDVSAKAKEVKTATVGPSKDKQ